ncbi:MAG: hypothetical protein QS721_15325 [Candidatus Endonucleobacter sp. (ex Gigantidas childressi)]|nr:hypothetical protein [Candidatus Endonucleobacter sp. (ex Gigantidas childressi)]
MGLQFSVLGSPVVHFKNGQYKLGHFMWLRGSPFVSWNCCEGCNHRIRSPLDAMSKEYVCEQCRNVYQVNMSVTGVEVREGLGKK